MIKKHWKILTITSIIILLPILAGLILWKQLPDQIPTHWNMAGEVDGWSSKPFFVFFFPSLLFVIHWVCLLGTSADPKKENHPAKVLNIVFWIVPGMSVLLHAITYATAFDKEVKVETIMSVIIGLTLAIVGNYLPKCKQNYTIGIKIPWTLNSEENWNKTHRFAGRIWVAGGLLIMLTGFFGGFLLFFPIVLLMVILPLAYSYILHRKGI